MADESEEKPSSTHDLASTKASLFDTLNNLRKWREEKLAECRKSLEGEILYQQLRENKKQFGQLIENGIRHQNSETEDKPKETVPEMSDVSSISLPNDLDNCDTLQESSITAHMQRCFNDSTQSNVSISGNKVPHAVEKAPVFSELRNPQFSETKLGEKDNPMVKTDDDKQKTKRPFLKKRSGLRRFFKSNNVVYVNNNKDSPTVNKHPGAKSIATPELLSKPPDNLPSGYSFPIFPITFEDEYGHTDVKAKSGADPRIHNLLPKVKKFQLPQKTLKLKPALRKTDAPSEQVKHIRFDIADTKDDEDIKAGSNNNLLFVSNTDRNATGDNIIEDNSVEHPTPTLCTTSPENHKSDTSNSGNESLNLSKESEELKEFLLLEDCAQNSSFNSESSVVQRILQGGSAKPSPAGQKYSRDLPQNVISMKEVHIKPQENLGHSEKSFLSKCNEEVRARKQFIEGVISDINPRIESLQKEISHDKKQTFDDINDRCSTPMNLEDKNLISESDPNLRLSVSEVSTKVQANHRFDEVNQADSTSDVTCCTCKKCPVDDAVHIYNDEEDDAYNFLGENDEIGLSLNEKSKIRSKVFELMNEIKTYQKLNAELSSKRKEHEDALKKLAKEKIDFNKNKEIELQKLEARIQEERRQIKRQKETFNRFQKLRKDNPTKKERDELSALRLELEKSHEDFKRLKIKYENDKRRWTTRLDNAERERDNFKLENIRLEEQRDDLLTSLKARMKKNIKPFDDDCNNHNNEIKKDTVEKKDAESQTEEKELDCNVFQDSNQSSPKVADSRKSKSKVPLNTSENNNINAIDKDALDSPKNDNFNPVQNELINGLDSNRNVNTGNVASSVNLSEISVSGESDVKVINHGHSVEKIYASGERETFYNSGTRKVISADGKLKKFFFYNGDYKESSDGQEIYTYQNGVIETSFPDGLKITKFPNGQIQSRYPNGQKEVIFPDGTVHNFLSDGSEEIRTAEGNIVKNCTDGTKVIEYANGQREIRTSSYKRREFPDGSLKIVYESGRQETRYSNGRIKIKDKEGKILFDTKYLSS